MTTDLNRDDVRWMARALRLARQGWGATSPNPMVGAVVVRDGAVLGEGYHRQAGQPHAEIEALRAAGGDARDATLYVTLEPCCTYGRTPPCTEAICAAGIRRVVVATTDPDPRHRGRGFDILRAHGIAVTTGIERTAAQDLNSAFFCWVRHGRPQVLLKMAMTADGKSATRSGQSQWISGPGSRSRVQHLRRWADVIMVGGETVRRDDPQLLVREPADWPHQPLRVIASRSGDLGVSPQVLTDGRAKTRLVRFDESRDVHDFLMELGKESKTALLLEGGGELAGMFLEAGLIDQVALFLAPKILGGRESRPVIGGRNPDSLAEALRLHEMRTVRSGEDLLITGYLNDVHRYC